MKKLLGLSLLTLLRAQSASEPQNLLYGYGNKVQQGYGNVAIGQNNQIKEGNLNQINGNLNYLDGDVNKITGHGNIVQGTGNLVKGQGNVVLADNKPPSDQASLREKLKSLFQTDPNGSDYNAQAQALQEEKRQKDLKEAEALRVQEEERKKKQAEQSEKKKKQEQAEKQIQAELQHRKQWQARVRKQLELQKKREQEEQIKKQEQNKQQVVKSGSTGYLYIVPSDQQASPSSNVYYYSLATDNQDLSMGELGLTGVADQTGADKLASASTYSSLKRQDEYKTETQNNSLSRYSKASVADSQPAVTNSREPLVRSNVVQPVAPVVNKEVQTIAKQAPILNKGVTTLDIVGGTRYVTLARYDDSESLGSLNDGSQSTPATVKEAKESATVQNQLARISGNDNTGTTRYITVTPAMDQTTNSVYIKDKEAQFPVTYFSERY